MLIWIPTGTARRLIELGRRDARKALMEAGMVRSAGRKKPQVSVPGVSDLADDSV